MCGIAGIAYIDSGVKVSEEVLRKMTSTMVYRGPDDEGYYLNLNVGLGFRRLSIIDIAEGHQPISNKDGKIWGVFNGEIYNFQELRLELKRLGHQFRTNSDSEVLVHLYEQYGSNCVERLRGMFAFAIYDKTKNKLILARDRFGKKPLYFSNSNGRLVFGSELKVVLAAGEHSRSIDPLAIQSYFAYGYVTGDNRSIFSGIEKCPPAHYMEFDCLSGGLTKHCYWKPEFSVDYDCTEEEWKERIRVELGDAVRCRLISDVPLGAFLSGGIDSSIVVAMMAKYSEQPVKTFSIGFKEQEYNELQYANEVVKMYGTEHYEQILEPESVDLLPKLVRAFDEPFADSSAIPTYYVSKFAREHVTVCLSGDGGDELFAGYTDYQKQMNIFNFNRLPAAINGALWGGLNAMLPSYMPGKGLSYYLSKDRKKAAAHFTRFNSNERGELFGNILSDITRNTLAPEKIKESLLSDCAAEEYLSCLQNMDISTWLVDDVLCKVDRTSMLNSLEVRAPLLDHKFAELAFKVPANLRIHKGDKKYILKQAMKDFLPDKVLSHRKQGFGVPLKLWFRKDLKEYINDRLVADNQRLGNYLDMAAVRKVVSDHDAGLRDLNHKLWSILVFDAWLEQNNMT